MQLDQAAWDEVRRLYCESTLSVRLIAAKFGVSPRTISNKAKKESWPTRPEGAPLPPGTPPKKAGAKLRATQPTAKAQTKAETNSKAKAKTKTSSTPAAVVPKPKAPMPEPQPTGKSKTKSGKKADMPSRKAQKDLVARLYRAISTKLEQMETRMANGEERSAQDEERETRALSTMIRNFEKVTEAAIDFESPRTKPNKAAEADTNADAERMRREITARLERLTGKRDADGALSDA